MNRCNYHSITEVVEKLNNSKIPYLILRNYENLLNDDMYVSGHEDIDILCERSEDIVKILNAKQTKFHQKGLIKDKTHYYIYINDKKVDLDLRFCGDGYYCKEWEVDMLQKRKMFNGFYVPCDSDYFYSLIYHAILQKKVFTEEYKERLWRMSKSCSIILDECSEKMFLRALESYMKSKGYKFVYTEDFYIPLQFQKVSKKLVVSNPKLQFYHLIFHSKIKLIETLVRLKHLFIK